MTQRHTQTGEGRLVRRYDYPDRTVLAVDLSGGATDSVAVDTVDQTAIVVIERDGEEEEFEFDLPGEAVDATANNGVVAVEVAA
ncbi:MAG: Hsp20/alpha crystallin family protein [Halobaculum sp.]|jgi:HSP20 family molecular chaperone IbpA